MKDYYETLGVPKSADMSAIRAAYRRRAQQWHPDRGGSHDQMKRLNEAYAILSDPEARRRYDEERAGRLHGAESAAFQQKKRSAQAQSDSYPRHWEDFVRWQESLAADFAKANYDAGWEIGDSASGKAFLYVGAFLGFCMALGLGLHWVGGVLLGAFVGKIAHFVFGGLVQLAAMAGRATMNSSSTSRSSKSNSGEAGTRFIPCGRCGQKLRLPRRAPRSTVKCPKCTYQFVYAPND